MHALACRVFAAVVLATLLLADASGNEKAAAAPYSHGLLWRVDIPGAAPSYLYGTIHSGDERVLALSPAARRAFEHSRRFALELIDDEDAAARFRAAMVTREPHLAALLGEQDFHRVDELLAARGVSTQARARFKPWAALIVLAQPPESAGIILDNVLLLDARKRNEPVQSLETIDDQIAALDDMALDDQLALLRQVSLRQDEVMLAAPAIVNAYLAGDLTAMWRINADAMGNDPAIAPCNAVFLERLLYQRSARFAEHLLPLLKQGGVFAAFGALHLYGERGVPALLARAGLRVTVVR